MAKIYFSADEVVRSLGVQHKKTSKGYKIHCLNPSHPDKNPSALIYSETGAFHCFSCGYHLSNYELSQRAGLIKDKDGVKKLLPSPKVVEEEEKKPVENPKHFSPIEGEYLKLNITKEMASIFKVGVCEAGLKDEVSSKCSGCFYEKNWIRDKRCGFAYGRVMIPIVMEGKLLSIESRLLTKSIRAKKVLYPEGSRTGEVIFNHDNLDKKKPLYVTEGIKGALKIYRYIDKNVTALFSNQLKGIQGNLIKEFSHVILLPDLGAAGEITVKQFSELGLSNLEVVSFPEVSICRACGKWTPGLKEKTLCQCGSEDTVYADVFDFELEDIKTALYHRKRVMKGSLIREEKKEKEEKPRYIRKKQNVGSRDGSKTVGRDTLPISYNSIPSEEGTRTQTPKICDPPGSFGERKNFHSTCLGCFHSLHGYPEGWEPLW